MVVMTTYDEFSHVIDRTRVMLHRAVLAAEAIHDGSEVTVPMRAVLEFLRRDGEHTVSAIARARSVSRQHIQVVVNELLDLGLVERIDNPQHRSAPLIRLTPVGEARIDEMHRRERDAFEPLLVGHPELSEERLRLAAAVVDEIGAVMAARREAS